ncbi:MAG: hypothetical protein ABR573_00190 [Candidatus Dormibacteria bacterium]
MLQPRLVEWDEAALTELESIAAHEPRAVARALIAAERMGNSGYDEGRPTVEPQVRYRPPYRPGERLGLFYAVTPTAFRIIWVVDARTLRQLP